MDIMYSGTVEIQTNNATKTLFLYSVSQYQLAWRHGYPVHLPNDTLAIAFENTVYSLIPKQNAII
jgi:hypothetical protein